MCFRGAYGFWAVRRRAAGPGRRAFSLVELLLVVAIIGALVGLLLPAAQRALLVARITRVQSDLRNLQTALHQYHLKFGAFPPTRKYCMASKRDQYCCLPRELWEAGCLDCPMEDAFNKGQTYRYSAIGPGLVNESPVMIKFYIPERFPKAGGDCKKYEAPEVAPVRWILWSVGPGGLEEDFTATLALNPLDPTTWYPEDPHGIICRYYTGKDWLGSP